MLDFMTEGRLEDDAILRRKPRPVEDRFWERIDASAGPDGCWPWQGGITAAGYGQIRRAPVGNTLRGLKTTTHRLAWELTYGPIPAGMHVCHRCDNPLCVNTTHLWLGTHAENLADMKAKGRAARGDRSGTARLNTKQVRIIKRLLVTGACSATELSVLAGVTSSAIDAIKSEKNWRHVDA